MEPYIDGIIKGIIFITITSIILILFSIFELFSSSNVKFSYFYLLLATIGFWQYVIIIPWVKKNIKVKKNQIGNGILMSSLLGICITFWNLDYFKSVSRIDLDKLEKKELLYKELPERVKLIYLSNDYKQYLNFISTDKKLKTKTYTTTLDDGFMAMIKEGNKHHFEINGKHLVLQANQGSPFILHDEKFYYCIDLNMNKRKVKTTSYIEIDLKNSLK